MRWPLLLLLVLVSSAYADDSAMTGMSGAPKPMKGGHPTIRMVSEVVRCEIPSGRVRAVFRFRNEGPATTVRMGFPERGWARALPKKGTTMKDFRTYVDGKRTRVWREQATGVGSASESNDYSAWWVKSVRFAAGQTRTVVDEYVGGMGEDSIGERFFHYILQSGRNWKGPIGSIRLFVDFRKLGHVSRLTFKPRGATVRNGVAKWFYQDVEPSFDIDVSWYNGYDSVSINGTVLSPDARLRSFYVTQPSKFWRGDVWMTVSGIANLIGARVRVVAPETAVELRKGDHSIVLRVGAVPKGPHAIGRRAVAYERKPYGGRFMALLGDVVRALGGTAKYDRKLDRIAVTTPAGP